MEINTCTVNKSIKFKMNKNTVNLQWICGKPKKGIYSTLSMACHSLWFTFEFLNIQMTVLCWYIHTGHCFMLTYPNRSLFCVEISKQVTVLCRHIHSGHSFMLTYPHRSLFYVDISTQVTVLCWHIHSGHCFMLTYPHKSLFYIDIPLQVTRIRWRTYQQL